ncbi:BON domain-containing protein [Edaphobacter modestus]|nr:BON domain-containing protein [Edaphobacter modestus]
MISNRFTPAALAATAFLCFLGAANSPHSLAQTTPTQTAPDNSTQNQNQSKTADDQTNAKADLDTTAQIRKSIMADKGLSTYAHNVKIITKNGTVTLKGPVNSEDEKQKVMSYASSVVSADKVTDKITVKQ